MQSHEGCIKHQNSGVVRSFEVLCNERFMPATRARRNKSMKRIGWTMGKTDRLGKVSSAVAAALLVMLALAHPARSWAQAAGASIHGHVTNPAGMAMNTGEVRLSTDRSSDPKDMKFQYKFPIGPNGDYKGSGIAPGKYIVFVYQDTKLLDFTQDTVEFANADDKSVNFAMSRADFLAKMAPADRTALQEYKKKKAEMG